MALTVIQWQFLRVWLFQASLSISRMSIPSRPDRCLESQGISKGFWGSPFMFCFCLCKKPDAVLFAWSRGCSPTVLRPQTSSQEVTSWKDMTWEKAKCGGLVFESCTPSPDRGLCGRRREWRSSAKMMQDIGSPSYCLWDVFYSSESEKKKKKKKSVNAAFPPHPVSTLQVWEENLREEKREGGIN